MSNDILVSVIVLNHNGKYDTKECVNSILKSRYKFIEVIIVDNGSTDDSYQYLQKLYSSKRKVVVIKLKPNRYITGGFNFGSLYAKGKKLIFMNNDTIATPHWINELLKVARKSVKFLVQPKLYSYWNRNVIDNIGGRYTIFGLGFGIGKNQVEIGQCNQVEELNYAVGTVLMIDKKFFHNIGMYDESYQYYYEDVDLSLRAKKNGGRMFIMPKSIIYHKISRTVDKYVNNQYLIYHVRKNQIRTILKNYTGISKYVRIFLLLQVYLTLILKDIVIGNFTSVIVTINAININFAKKSENNK